MSEKAVYNVGTKKEFQEVTYVGNDTQYEHNLTPECENKHSSTLFLYLTIFVVQIPWFTTGAQYVWNSPAVPMITSNDTQINPLGKPATPADISLIVALPALVGLSGSLTLPQLANHLGRKWYIQITVLLTLIAYMVLAFSTSVTTIVVSKCIASIFGCGGAVIPIYITEVCEDHNRAKFGCLIGVFLQLGHFYTFIIGPLLSYTMFNILISFPLVIFLVVFPFFPETPVYLISKGKRAQCEQVLKKLRSNKSSTEIRQDINKMEESVKLREYTKTKRKLAMVTLFNTKEGRVGLLFALLPLAVQYLSGMFILVSFMAPFFNSTGTGFSGEKVALVVSAVKITCMTFTSTVVDRVGRKRMLLISIIGTGIPLFGLGWFFYLKHINSSVIQHIQWLPIVLVLLNVAFYSLGLGSIPTAIMHEMFTPEKRAAAGSIISIFTAFIISSISYSYPLIAATGVHWAVWLYSCNCFIGAGLIYKFLPQTRGKTLSEIQELLKQY